MAHISLPNEQLPGIVGLMDFRKDTAKILSELAETLLRGESTLTRGEREIIASSVSYENNCHFCHTSHGAAASAHLNKSVDFIDEIKKGIDHLDVSPKLKSLLKIAHKVQKQAKDVSSEDIALAKNEGATDMEIHDTVLIASAFCMFNRYVDGLGTWAPESNDDYAGMGELLANEGYVRER
ncbi:MAG: carboxymuconolactone decarboxylase family protein [Balneolales bacterium]